MYYIKYLAVDFDQTLNHIDHVDYPACYNPDLIGFAALKKFQDNGGKVILWTCRTDEHLTQAVDFCHHHGLIPNAVNSHLPEQIESFSKLFPHVTPDTRKVYCDAYIDDKCISFLKKGYVDWYMVNDIINGPYNLALVK